MEVSERWHDLKERGIDEFRRFLIMFAYLWAAAALLRAPRDCCIDGRG